MFDLYKKRMSVRGSTPSENIRKSNADIIDNTFIYDSGYSVGLVEGQKVELRFYHSSAAGIDKDISSNKIQFRPYVKFKTGTIIDIPEYEWLQSDYDYWEKEPDIKNRGRYVSNDGIHYKRWLIAGHENDVQFNEYFIVPCNWCLSWIRNGKLYKQLGSLRVRNSYSSGIYEQTYVTALEEQEAIWLPINDNTKTITYDQRVLISENDMQPQAYKVSSLSTTHPQGIIRVICKLSTLQDDDDYKNMIANGLHYIEPEQVDTTESFSVTYDKELSVMNTSVFTAHHFVDGNEIDILNSGIDFVWNYELIDSDNAAYITNRNLITMKSYDDKCEIACANHLALIGEKIKVTFTTENNDIVETICEIN